ncbi:MAG TPA: ATP-binding protein [bacterium]|nr:ATP-binding protein [bacterium]
MIRSRLAFKTFWVFVTIATVSMGIAMLVSGLVMRRLAMDATRVALEQSAVALARVTAIDDTGVPTASVVPSGLSSGDDMRITIVLANGTVLADSASDPSTMENHASRPEIRVALEGRFGTSVRRSPTLGKDMVYAAAPVYAGGRVAGALRVAMSAPGLNALLARFIVVDTLVALVMTVLMAWASIAFGNRITEPITALMDAAGDWSAGRLERRVRRFPHSELAPLAETMNAMAARLADQVVAMRHQQQELQAILEGMGEAVISVDTNLTIMLANSRARELLGHMGASAAMEGHALLEASGNGALEALARSCAADGQSHESEITLYGDTARIILAHAAPLSSDDGSRGVVLVLNDITRLKRLERIRQDFVANVSHELKTPITLITGFAETLETVQDPAETRRFVAIIKRHADRMTAIIEDLLTLARLESPVRGTLALSQVRADSLVAHAIESLDNRPAQRRITIEQAVDPELVAQVNEGLFEQALVNLLDNAIKYGPEGGMVRVAATVDGVSLVFSVTDQGPGIPARDLPRLFERFYRVDRARSKNLGGTGLGLAIVKHVAMAHGGDASVSSIEGSGSAFFISIPLQACASVQDAAPDAETPTANS